MKKQRLIALICIVVCCFTLATSALATAERSSQQIDVHTITATSSNGVLTVEFWVRSYVPTYLGCESIEIYKKEGSRWMYVDGKSENNFGMSTNGAIRHENSFSFNCVPGTEYKVDVTVFADDINGRDTRSKTIFLTGR